MKLTHAILNFLISKVKTTCCCKIFIKLKSTIKLLLLISLTTSKLLFAGQQIQSFVYLLTKICGY